MTDDETAQEYPYSVIGFEFTDREYHRYTIFQKFLDSMPDGVAWYGPGSLMEYTLKTQYNAVILDGYFRFKTEADLTYFLLRWS